MLSLPNLMLKNQALPQASVQALVPMRTTVPEKVRVYIGKCLNKVKTKQNKKNQQKCTHRLTRTIPCHKKTTDIQQLTVVCGCFKDQKNLRK